jgi:hypothetical protein
MEEKYIVAMNPGGISNRLKCLISLWRIANLTNRKLLVYWPRNPVCGAEFKDLFENNFDEISKEYLYSISGRDYKFHDPNDISIKNMQKKYLISDTWRWAFLKDEEITKHIAKNIGERYPLYKSETEPFQKNDGIDFSFHDIDIKVRKEILKYLKKIKPIKKIEGKVSKFSSKNKIKNCTGIHIRRGDYMNGKDRIGFVSDDESFINRMNELIKINSKERFFLCTDSEETQQKFIKIFGKRIITFTKTNFDRNGVIFTQEGLIDLLILSKTKRILGTYGSTFTEMSWWLGECKPIMEIIINKENLKVYLKNFKRINKGIFKKIKRVIAILIGRAPKFR